LDQSTRGTAAAMVDIREVFIAFAQSLFIFAPAFIQGPFILTLALAQGRFIQILAFILDHFNKPFPRSPRT
jgi:hypothetical protein